jgi:hypothetical protein
LARAAENLVLMKQGDGTPGGRQITVQAQLVGAPESSWDEIGWGAFKSDTHRSRLAGVLTPDQLDSLLQAVKEPKDAGMANPSPPRTCRDGERIQLSWAIPEVNESQYHVYTCPNQAHSFFPKQKSGCLPRQTGV